VTVDLDRAGPAFNHSRAMIDAVDDFMSDQARRFLALALGWHILWGALLLPYAIGIALILGGQAAAQDLVDSLASTFFLPVLFLFVSLPLNLALAALTARLLKGLEPAIELSASAVIFALAWLIGIQGILPVADPSGGFAVNPIAVWAALAGTVYGLVLPAFNGPRPGRAERG
jgi:hypothetical protein